MGGDWDRALLSLRHFAKLHGSLKPLKTTFTIPVGDSKWPTNCQGFRLGYLLNNLRRKGPKFYARKYPSFFNELRSMGFVWDAIAERHKKLLSALRVYKSIHGDLKVPLSFVVPKDDQQWPVDTWNMKLGSNVKNIRNLHISKKIRARLEELGFDYDYQKKPHDFEDLFLGLVAFKREHGHFLVPQMFVVSEDDARYPPGLRGSSFGMAVATMLRKRYYFKQHEERLESIGFRFRSRAEIKFNIIFEALQCYQRLYGHVRVSDRFVVPRNSKHFSRAVWGNQLGRTARRMVLTKCYQPFLPRLQELGIDVEVWFDNSVFLCVNTYQLCAGYQDVETIIKR